MLATTPKIKYQKTKKELSPSSQIMLSTLSAEFIF